MQFDGNLVWYTRNFPNDDVIKDYRATGTKDSGFQFIFNQSGYFNLVTRNGTVLSHLFSNLGPSTVQYYQRLTMDYDGVLRHYVYPKSADLAGGRPMAWSVYDFLPQNLCTSILQDVGGGACGVNIYCSLRSADQRPQCSCPPGYSVVDPSDPLSGCKLDFVRQSCDQESEENDEFALRDMRNTDWPFSDYAHYTGVREDWCRRACLTDCFCDVAIFRGTDCWKKRVPLSNGRNDPNSDRLALIKIRRGGGNGTTPKPTNNRKTPSSSWIVPGSILFGSSVFVNILLFASLIVFFRRKSSAVMVEPGKRDVDVRCFTFKELKEATDGFKEELGSGAYSTVFKGVVNGEEVAVKRLDRIVSEAEGEFKAEMNSISRTNHRSLVKLLGYCDEGQHRLLVYEFMSNGSLANFIFQNSSRPKPSLYTRMQIAFAIALGLCCLHEECSTQIIHCDIKPQKVLLDDSYTAKISDFGLAKLLRPEQTRTITAIRGTRGYGVMLLELLCCRKNYEPDMEDERKQILSDWAYDCCNEGRMDLLVGDEAEMSDDVSRFEKMVKIALWCIQEDPEMRPQMRRVIQMLEGSAQVPPPPDPASAI